MFMKDYLIKIKDQIALEITVRKAFKMEVPIELLEEYCRTLEYLLDIEYNKTKEFEM